jgi:hypothetical protein
LISLPYSPERCYIVDVGNFGRFGLYDFVPLGIKLTGHFFFLGGGGLFNLYRPRLPTSTI